MAVFFDGRLLETPTTASVVNDDAMRNQNLSVGNVLALVGKSSGGKPKSRLEFGSPTEAKKVLRSGELLEAVLKAFTPSGETGGPQSIIAVRVNPALPAALSLVDAASAEVIMLASTGYGLGENQIKARIETGSISGKRLTTQLGSAYYTADNIGRTALSVQYTGAAATATISVTATTVTLAAAAATPVVIPLAEFSTVGSLVDRINSEDGFHATVEERSDTKATLNGLDFVTAAGIKGAAVAIKADLQAVVDWFNGTGEGYVTATRAANAGTVPANIPFTYLAGGSDGVTTNTDWSDAFDSLQFIDVQWLTALSGDAAIRAMADTHIQFCSKQLRRERRGILGMPVGSTDLEAADAAKELNSDRTSLVHLGNYDYDLNGKLVLFPPYNTAAIIAGAFAGVNPGTPLTNKTINVRGLERDLLNPTDTDVLIRAGVLCVENTDEGYKVVKSISTWLVNDNYNRVEQSTGFALDYTARSVRKALDVLRGQKGNPLVLARAISITESTLKELAKPEPQGPGVLAGDAANPAYKNITASLNGDVLRTDYECSPVIPVNFVLNTIYATPFSGSASA